MPTQTFTLGRRGAWATALLVLLVAGVGVLFSVGAVTPDRARVRARLQQIGSEFEPLEYVMSAVPGDYVLVGSLDLTGAYRRLIEELHSDDDPSVRIGAAAICDLRGWADDVAFSALLTDPDPRAAQVAIEMIRWRAPLSDADASTLVGMMETRSAAAAPGARYGVLQDVMLTLQYALGPEHVAYAGLVDRILDPSAPIRVRVATAASLRSFSPDDTARMLEAVAAGDAVTSRIAVDCLPDLSRVTPEAVAGLARLIREEELAAPGASGGGGAEQSAVAESLAALHDARQVLPVFGTYRPVWIARELGPHARAAAPALRDRLLAVVEEQNARRSCVDALRSTGIAASDVTPELLALRQHADPNVAGGVAEIVERSGYESGE